MLYEKENHHWLHHPRKAGGDSLLAPVDDPQEFQHLVPQVVILKTLLLHM